MAVNLIDSQDITITQADNDIQLNVIKDNSISTVSTKAVENQAITNYVDLEINRTSTYSTNETRIGTWVDGKPLYRQVLHKVLSDAVNQLVGTINNVDLITINGNSVMKYDSGGANYFTSPATSYETTTNWTKVYTMINRSTHSCNVYWNGSEAAEIWVVCEYTKSTD